MKKFARKNHLDYPILLKGSRAAKDWGVEGIPDNFLIDSAGNIVARHVVIDDKTISRIESRIRKLIE